MLKHPPVFIVGCARSGTTILGELLDRHPDLKVWYEPYFVWDMHLPLSETDARTEAQAEPSVVRYLQREFEIFERKGGGRTIVEKSPDACFRIPFIHAVFPDARWVHIFRDGRDVALSIHEQWRLRAEQVQGRKFLRHIKTVVQYLGEQTYWRNRFQRVWYELTASRSLRPSRFLNKARWMGFPGWGPRFPGWKEAYQSMELLEFNALQWVKSVEQVQIDSARLPAERVIELRYEDLMARPTEELTRILAFLGLEAAAGELTPDGLKRDNAGKWRTSLDARDRARITAIQGDLLTRLGYDL